MTGFERSSTITDRITTIREMPSSSVSERDEKREEARELRMAIRLENAAFIDETMRLVQRNPDITGEKLTQFLSATSTITHPEAAANFVGRVIENRDYVNQVYEELLVNKQNVCFVLPGKKKFISGSYVAANMQLSTSVSSESGTTPPPTRYPFAVTVSADPLLFKVLYHNDKEVDGVAGFYASTGYSIKTDKVDINFPLLVVRANYGANVTSHERGHDTNALFQKSMFVPNGQLADATFTEEDIHNKSQYIATWGALRLVETSKVALLKQDTATLSDKQLQTKFKAMDWAVSYAASCAKDELLADYLGSFKSGETPMKSHYGSVVNNPLYDYFKKHMGLSETSDTYLALKERYLEVLEDNVEPAMATVSRYQTCGWGCRAKALRNVLMQVPLEKWAKTLETDLYNKESQLAEQCLEYQELLKEYVGNMNFNFITQSGDEATDPVIEHYTSKSDSERFKDIKEEYQAVQDKFDQIRSQSNVTTPMLQELEELRISSSDLLTRAQAVFESSDAYQYKLAYEKLIARFPEHLQKDVRSRLSYELVYSNKSFYGTLTHFQARSRYQLDPRW